MWTHRAELTFGVVLLAAASACSVETRNEETASATPPEQDDIGTAPQALTPAYCILNAHTDAATVHFQGSNWLLSSSEGVGPQELNVFVHKVVWPAVSVADTFKLDPSTISAAVGYSVAERHELIGGANAKVPALGFQRLEAYTSFQRTIWEIRDPSCSTFLGYGTSFRPVGVYFRVINTSDAWIPDANVTFFGPEWVAPGVPVPVGPIEEGPRGAASARPGPGPAPILPRPPGAIGSGARE